MPNRLTYPNKNWKFDNGGEVLWEDGLFTKSKRGTLRVRFLCAAKKILGDECKGKGDARASHVLGRNGLNGARNFRALHDECYRKILGRPDADKFVTPTMPFSTGEFPFPQGTTALLDIRLPQQGKKFARIAIKCRGCFVENENNLKYVNSLNLRQHAKGCVMRALALVGFAFEDDKTTWCRIWPHLIRWRYWSELCSDCIEKRGSIKRFVGWKVAPSGTRVHFPEDITAPALVYYKLCSCVRDLNRTSAINTYDELSAACRTHTRQILEQMAVSGTLQPQNGNGHGNGHSKQGRPVIVPAERILLAVKAVAARWDSIKNNGQPYKRQLASIALTDLTTAFRLSDEGDYKQVNKRVSDWLAGCRLGEMFPDAKQPFRKFKEAVIDQLKLGKSAEQIASSLESRLAPVRAAA